MDTQTTTSERALALRARIARSPARGLAAVCVATLLLVGLSTRQLSSALDAGESSAIARGQAALAIADTRVADALRAQAGAEQARASAESARAAFATELESLTPPPLPDDSRIAWAGGAVVGVQASNIGLGRGTGFAVAYRGGATYIVTALHVLNGATSATVTTKRGSYMGQVVAVSSADAALLKIDGLIPILFFARRAPAVGESVAVVGADGRTDALTVAEVSADVLRLAQPVRPANYWVGFSGSPVIRGDGTVIGIMSSADGNTADAVPRAATCDIVACPPVT